MFGCLSQPCVCKNSRWFQTSYLVLSHLLMRVFPTTRFYDLVTRENLRLLNKRCVFWETMITPWWEERNKVKGRGRTVGPHGLEGLRPWKWSSTCKATHWASISCLIWLVQPKQRGGCSSPEVLFRCHCGMIFFQDPLGLLTLKFV